MRRMSALLVVGLLAPGITLAQNQPVAEIGTNLGVTIQNASGNTLTLVGVPGEGILGQSTLYATFFAGEAVMVEPQLAFNILASGGDADHAA